MDNNRKAAYLTLVHIEENKAYSNIETGKQIQSCGAENPAFVRELVYGTLRHKITLDYYLNQLVKKGFRKLPAPVLVILRMGLYQIREMHSVPSYAAVNESVKLTAKYANRYRSFVNGVLRSAIRTGENFISPDEIKSLTERLSVMYSFHESIVDEWLREYGEENTKALLERLNETPKLCLSVNLGKISREELAKEFIEQGMQVEIPEGRKLPIYVTGSNVLAGASWEDGLFYVQNASSSLAVEKLNPKPGNRILDICAAPGGKSRAAAILSEDSSEIYSFDIYPHKITLMEKEANRLGLHSIKCMLRDGATGKMLNNEEFPEGKFQRIICDVPCSGLGVIARKPEIKYKNIELEDQELPDLQYNILELSSKYLDDNGILMYSTCTIRKAENEDVVRRFLQEHDAFEIIEEKQIFPDGTGADGFYYCLLSRRG